jgi:hypothetical protein
LLSIDRSRDRGQRRVACLGCAPTDAAKSQRLEKFGRELPQKYHALSSARASELIGQDFWKPAHQTSSLMFYEKNACERPTGLFRPNCSGGKMREGSGCSRVARIYDPSRGLRREFFCTDILLEHRAVYRHFFIGGLVR